MSLLAHKQTFFQNLPVFLLEKVRKTWNKLILHPLLRKMENLEKSSEMDFWIDQLTEDHPKIFNI